jgi:uncharacterized protein YbaP (TraB family)
VDDGFDPKLLARFMEALLTKRNQVMAKRIGEKLKSAPGKSQFFAIGAGHLMAKTASSSFSRSRGSRSRG